MRLNRKRALITGATTGIGRAIAEAFIAEGAQIVISGHDPDRVAAAASELGAAGSIASNLAEPDSAAGLVADATTQLDGLDIVVCNAGLTIPAPVGAITADIIDAHHAIHVRSPLLTVQAAADTLSANAGNAILITSMLHTKGLPGMTPYAASKGAQRALVRGLAAELVDRGVRVNAIAPGPINTPIYAKLGLPEEQLNEMAGGIQAQVPMNRFGQPSEIASAAVWLASPEAAYVTGEEVTIDGGWANL